MIRMTTVTASTSVILVDTASGLSPYIVYFPYISSVGRIITVRDNDGYASTGNSVILSTSTGAYFPDNQSTLVINQPYGFITLCSEPNGYFSILNTFAFPTGSASAYVYNVNTNSLGINDSATSNFESVTISSGILYYGSTSVGNVTTAQLNSNITYLDSKFLSSLNSSLIVRRYILVGNSGTANVATGSIQYSDNITTWNNALGGTQGFLNGGTDILVGKNNLYIACGNNYDPGNPTNLGFLQWSEDGLIWNNSLAPSPTLSVTTTRSRISYANALWHAVGLGTDSNAILWSSDGKVWYPSIDSANTFDSPGFNSITYGKNIWVACGSNSLHPAYSIIYSSDGSNWNPNPTLNTSLNPFYDITFTGSNFIAIASNSTIFPQSYSGNIVISTYGSNDSVIIPVNLNNEPGFVANNGSLVLVVTSTYHKFSINFGYTWNDMADFPTGTPGRPYYDGSLWWVGMNNGTTSNLYYSTSGSNLWINTQLTGNFPTGYPQSVTSLNVSSNLGLQLTSTVMGIEQTLTVSSFNTGSITTGSFTIINTNNTDGDILNISSFNKDAFVSINNLSTNFIMTSTIRADSIEISSINTSALYVSDSIYTSTIVSDYISTASLYFSSLNMSSMFTYDLSTNNINVSSISSGIATIDTLNAKISYSDIVSTNITVISTVNLVDNTTGILTEINANNGSLFFQGQKLLTIAGANPLYITYQLQDISTPSPGAIPGATGFFTVDTADLRTISVINFSVTDYYNTALIGFFNKLGLYSVIHIINTTTLQDSIYLIETITPSTDLSYFTLGLTHLVGITQILNIGDIYNFYIGNIGIKPAPTSPTDTVVVKAPISGSSFSFNGLSGALAIVPSNIGTYSAGTSGFTIRLNSTNYNSYNIPATVGSITFYDGTKYIQVNVKYGSISTSSGATINIDGGVNNLVIDGLTRSNFGASNDLNDYAIYITIKFLN